ncbi:MAG: PAS domain S-box protein [candidate division Zixibacteria bacterium]|nr:PAS domain S-box protein [candidate division Zixibacteria bacterium]
MFKLLFDRTRDMLVVINPKGEIITTNNSIQDELGYSGKDLLKRRITHIIYKNDQRRFATAIKALFDKRGEFHSHLSLVDNDGSIINIEAICYTIQNPNLLAILNFHILPQVDGS